MSDRDDYRGRVTVDIDGYVPNWRLTAIRSYYNLSRLADDVEVHISSSGRGLHLIGWFRDEQDFPTRLRLRRSLNDDPNRIKMDLERYMNDVYTGVLWSEKSDRESVKDRSFGDIHDAIRHMDMTNTDDADRMQSLAEHGHKGAPDLSHYAGGWDA